MGGLSGGEKEGVIGARGAYEHAACTPRAGKTVRKVRARGAIESLCRIGALCRIAPHRTYRIRSEKISFNRQ